MQTHARRWVYSERRRRARRRRQRRQSRSRRTRGCRQVVRRLCGAGSRARGTCRGSAGTKRTNRSGCRGAAATPHAGVVEPTRLEAAATPSARPPAGARARISSRVLWGASILRAGNEERAGRSVRRVATGIRQGSMREKCSRTGVRLCKLHGTNKRKRVSRCSTARCVPRFSSRVCLCCLPHAWSPTRSQKMRFGATRGGRSRSPQADF